MTPNKNKLTQGYSSKRLLFMFPVVLNTTINIFICSWLKLFMAQKTTSKFEIFIPWGFTEFRLYNFFYYFRMVLKGMFTVAFTKFEINNFVIKSITINVMNTFLGFKKSTNLFLHNNTMFINIPLFLRKGMVWNIETDIFSSFYSTFKIPRFITFFISPFATTIKWMSFNEWHTVNYIMLNI